MFSSHPENGVGRTNRFIGFCLVAGILWCVPHPSYASDANSDTDRRALINLTQNYFNAVAARDTASLRDYLLPNAQFIYRNGEPLNSMIGVTTVPDLLVKLPVLSGDLLERMREPTVLVQGNIGMLWTRYDFYQNKQFSHCGTDAFTFLKTQDGWRIAGGSWSVEKTTCNPEPLNLPLK